MKKVVLILVVLAMLGLAQMAMAQINTNPAVNTAKISAVKGESLSISAADVPQFTIDPGATASTSSQNLTITTNWNLAPGRKSVDVCASAGTLAASNIANNPDTISGDAVQISKDNGTSWTTLNGGAGCSAGTNVTVVNSYVFSDQSDRKSKTKVDTVKLQLAGVSATLQADEYTGNITVYAYVQ